MRELLLASSPHIRRELDTQRVMFYVILALIPPLIIGIYLFGIRALILTVVSLLSCVGSEYAIRRIMKREQTIHDLSAVVTGLITALILPPTMPIWMVILGCVFAIVVVKEFFGGLGKNIFNPAASARVFLMAAWPAFTNRYIEPSKLFSKDWFSVVDGITSATPHLRKLSEITITKGWDRIGALFWGNISGSMGETSALAILIGAAFLLAVRVIRWDIPFIYLGTSLVLALIANYNPIYYIFVGGLMFGAFFMATDYVTTPNTSKGRVIFAVGLGILTFIIRRYGSLPEGVVYSILIMNGFTPLIDSLLKPPVFGKVRVKK